MVKLSKTIYLQYYTYSRKGNSDSTKFLKATFVIFANFPVLVLTIPTLYAFFERVCGGCASIVIRKVVPKGAISKD